MMKYGLIGERLGHSFSKVIHEKLADYKYELCPLMPDELDAFMTKRDFTAINVTIPYKEAVIPYLYYISPEAERIGAVNTIVNRDGKLYGYNTDIHGMTELAKHAGIDLRGKKVAVLGTGGTSKAAVECATMLDALGIVKVSRRASDEAITYDELYSDYSDVEIVINTTPVGMYPNGGAAAIDLSRLPALEGVIDAVYNPIRPRLVCEAKKSGIPAEGGLYMLVAQAVKASEIFLDTEYPTGITDKIFEEIRKKKENIILVGMPSCGKSTVGQKIAKRLGRQFVDTDDIIRRAEEMEIPEIFKKHGEPFFRECETKAVRCAAIESGLVIATGGGAVLKRENVEIMRENGRIYFIDRSIDLLLPTEDRPLSSSSDDLERRYKERYPIYTACADVRIDGDGSISEVAESIIKEFCK